MPEATLLEPPVSARPSSGGGPRGGSDGGSGGGGGGRDGALPFGNARLLMALMLIASTMLFSAFVGGLIVLRESAEQWPPPGSPELPLSLGINTLVILASSVALVLAHLAQRKGRARALRGWLAAATAGGCAFLALQWICWSGMLAAGWRAAVNNYLGNFYLLTTAHFAHAAAGTILLLVASAKAFGRRSPAQLALTLDLTAMFWHFVGLVWLVIFALLQP